MWVGAEQGGVKGTILVHLNYHIGHGVSVCAVYALSVFIRRKAYYNIII